MPLSVRYRQNEASDYARYFVSPIGGEDEVFFHQHRKSVAAMAKGLSRLFYSPEVEQASYRMAKETAPDVAYVLYYLRKMSPSLLVGLKKAGIPIVARISDYGMVCGEHHMLRNDRPCGDCMERGIISQVRYRCIKGSLAISLLDALATTFHRWRGYFDLIDHFVTTNEFMTDVMVRAQFPRERITCIPTFTDNRQFKPAKEIADPAYIAFVGRLDRPKGVHLLIEAMAMLRERRGFAPVLKIAGSGHDENYVSALRQRAQELSLGDCVQFLGAVPPGEVRDILRGAYATMMPALWFENLPNSVIEAFACGCPVVGSALGSLNHTIADRVNGLHHRPGDAADIAAKLDELLSDRVLRDRLARQARVTAETTHSAERHIARLLDLFGQVAPSARRLEAMQLQ